LPVLVSAAVIACSGCAACGKTPSADVPSDGDAPGRVDARTVVAARCRPTQRELALEHLEDAEFGDALAFPGGIAVGVAHRTSAGRMSALAILPPGLQTPRLVDLAPILGDAPPPRVAWRGPDLLVSDYLLRPKAERPDGAHELAVFAVNPTAPPPSEPGVGAASLDPIATVPRQRGDSLAFDLAHSAGRTLVVWDETAVVGAPRGVIRAVLRSGNGDEPARDVSPPESDAEEPRVLPNGAGFVVLWLARRPEHGAAPERSAADSAGSPSQATEVTAEARAFSWLEMVSLDANGAQVQPARRLTSATGHVSAYDVAVTTEERHSTSAVVVVARDDGEAVDGSGGALLRVRVGDDAPDAVVELPTDGLGRGVPTLLGGPSHLLDLTWIDQHERLRLSPLEPNGSLAGPSSVEDGLGESRLLLRLDREQVLAERRSGSSAALAVFSCPR
jgi:hypothetical protein